MRFGAHCVLYGAEIASNPELVLRRLAGAGAEGCEIGQRFFGTDNGAELAKALDMNHVELSGMHCNGVNLIDLLHNPEKSKTALTSTAQFLAAMKNKNVIATGCIEMEKIKDKPLSFGAPEEELHNPENVRQMAVELNKIVKEIKDKYGVQVHYHNHSWEFADNGLIFNTLMEFAPDLMFALDIGWAGVSGFSPVELLRGHPHRFQYVHLRDFKKSNQAGTQIFSEVHKSYVELGTGDVDYAELMHTLDEVLEAEDWAVVEYELGNFDETSYASALSYLRGMYDMIYEGRKQ